MKIKPALGEEEIDRLVRPKLKLFLSVDIVGSTHFKGQNPKADTPKWVELFIGFYSTFPDMLVQALAEVDHGLVKALLWKALGDELIFTVELKRRRDASKYVRAFAIALRSTAKNWHTSDDTAKHALHLKGAAWLVGFPVANVEIPLNRESSTAGDTDDLDYIGPLVDIGFRLKDHASARKLILSADLAYMMIRSEMSASMVLHFDGEAVLKGVLGGSPYPIVWLDNDGHPAAEHVGISANLHRLKDELRNFRPANLDKLSEYLKCWLEGVNGCPPVPFICEDLNSDFAEPPGYRDRLVKTQTDLRKVFYPQGPQEIENSGESQMPPAMLDILKELERERTG